MGPPSWRLRYGVAISSTLLALALMLLLEPLIGPQRLAPVLAAVIFSAWYGGLAPGLLATLLGALGSFGLPLAAHPAGVSPEFPTRLGMFLVVSVLISGLTEALRSAQGRAETVARKLRVSEAWYRRVIDTAYEGVWITDAGGRTEYVNDRMAEMLGYTAGEMLGRPLFDFLDDAARAEAERSLEQREQGIPEQHDFRFRRKDGADLWAIVSTNPFLNEQGEFTGALAMITDVTKRRQAEEALRESEQRFRATFDQAPIGIAHVGTDGQWLRVNQKLCDIVGYTREELLERTFQDVTHPDDLEPDLANIRRVLANEIQTYSMEKRYIRKDGSLVWIHLTVSLLREPTGAPKYFISMVEEIGERKRLEEALRQRAAALAEADRRKDEFLAMLAHELRNPLAAIDTALHVARMPESDAAGRQAALDVVERQVRHQTRLVDDLLDVSRITRGKIALRRERVDLAQLLRESAADHRRPLEAAGLELALELPAEPVWVNADATRLAQVADNLLQNAAKFTDPGGRVTVRLAVEGLPAVGREALRGREGFSHHGGTEDTEKYTEKGAREKAGLVLPPCTPPCPPCLRGESLFVKLTVHDTGIGIAREMLPRVFEPLTQADRTLDRSQGGLGLGLALVNGLVALHGGEVSAASDGPGRGATFTVHLPLERAPNALPTAPPTASANAVRKGESTRRRILLVEDNDDVAEVLCALLQLYGHAVEVASTGPDGLAAARRLQPEVVLCDIGLPGMDGYAVARALRRDPSTAAARLIAISGYGMEADRQRSAEAGFERHLMKPISPTELQGLLVGD